MKLINIAILLIFSILLVACGEKPNEELQEKKPKVSKQEPFDDTKTSSYLESLTRDSLMGRDFDDYHRATFKAFNGKGGEQRKYETLGGRLHYWTMEEYEGMGSFERATSFMSYEGGYNFDVSLTDVNKKMEELGVNAKKPGEAWIWEWVSEKGYKCEAIYNPNGNGPGVASFGVLARKEFSSASEMY